MSSQRVLVLFFLALGFVSWGCEASEGSDEDATLSAIDSGASDAETEPEIDAQAQEADGSAVMEDAEASEADAAPGDTPEELDGGLDLQPDASGIEMARGFICDPAAEPGSFHSMSADLYPTGEARSMCEYRDRVLLIANTAALCGFTPQYEQMQALNRQYEREGLTVLGFLTNDFNNQGGSDQEVEMCNDQFRITFPQFNHLGVTSRSRDGQHPLFAWLTSQPGFEGEIPWNFSKFLVNHEGRLLGRWDHFTSPNDPAIVQAIGEALSALPLEPRRD